MSTTKRPVILTTNGGYYYDDDSKYLVNALNKWTLEQWNLCFRVWENSLKSWIQQGFSGNAGGMPNPFSYGCFLLKVTVYFSVLYAEGIKHAVPFMVVCRLVSLRNSIVDLIHSATPFVVPTFCLFWVLPHKSAPYFCFHLYLCYSPYYAGDAVV